MEPGTYWSVEECSWVPGEAPEGLYWSVQRCRWEPVGGVADALATPWSLFAESQPDVVLPQQRADRAAPVDA